MHPGVAARPAPCLDVAACAQPQGSQDAEVTLRVMVAVTPIGSGCAVSLDLERHAACLTLLKIGAACECSVPPAEFLCCLFITRVRLCTFR